MSAGIDTLLPAPQGSAQGAEQPGRCGEQLRLPMPATNLTGSLGKTTAPLPAPSILLQSFPAAPARGASPALSQGSRMARAPPTQPKFLGEVPAQGSPAKAGSTAKLQFSVASCTGFHTVQKRVIMLLSSLLLFYFVDGEKMGISYSLFPPNGENLFFFFFFFPLAQAFYIN